MVSEAKDIVTLLKEILNVLARDRRGGVTS